MFWTQNEKSDLVAMATASYSTIPTKIVPVLKTLVLENTEMNGFLHLLLYLFSYSRLTILIFDVCKSNPQTVLMTWIGLSSLNAGEITTWGSYPHQREAGIRSIWYLFESVCVVPLAGRENIHHVEFNVTFGCEKFNKTWVTRGYDSLKGC